MKLILERDEIVRIIGKHFDATLDPDKVIIRTDPEFEIEVSGIPLSDTEPEPMPKHASNVVSLPARVAATTPAPFEEEVITKRSDDNATLDPPEPGLDEVEATDEGEIHPAAIIAKSRELAAKIDSENPQLNQQRRRQGGTAKPPSDYRDEI